MKPDDEVLYNHASGQIRAKVLAVFEADRLNLELFKSERMDSCIRLSVPKNTGPHSGAYGNGLHTWSPLPESLVTAVALSAESRGNATMYNPFAESLEVILKLWCPSESSSDVAFKAKVHFEAEHLVNTPLDPVVPLTQLCQMFLIPVERLIELNGHNPTLMRREDNQSHTLQSWIDYLFQNGMSLKGVLWVIWLAAADPIWLVHGYAVDDQRNKLHLGEFRVRAPDAMAADLAYKELWDSQLRAGSYVWEQEIERLHEASYEYGSGDEVRID